MDTIKCLNCGLVNMSSDTTCERCQAPLRTNVPSYVTQAPSIELSAEERRKIYEEEKAKLEQEQKQVAAQSAKAETTTSNLGQMTRAVSTAPETKAYLKIILVLCGVVVLAYILASWNKSSTPIQTTEVSSSQAGRTASSNPTASPVFRENFGGNSAAVAPAPSTSSSNDPVNDQSEEGIRQNIVAANENKEITYERLKKNADKYDGEPWAFTGRILQIQEPGGQTFALVSLDAYGNNLLAVRANFTTDFVEKNQVYVVGYLSGNYSYKSVAGWDMTVPLMDARAILKPSEAARIRAGKVK